MKNKMYLLSHAMSLSNVLVNVVGIHPFGTSFMMSKSNSWHDFIGTVSSYNKMKRIISRFLQHIPQKARDTNNVQIFPARPASPTAVWRAEGNTNSNFCVGFAGSERGFTCPPSFLTAVFLVVWRRGALLFLFATTTLFAQLSEHDVRQRLDLIHSGKIEQVRAEVSSLLKQLPNDPGVKYLEAYVTENGDQAVKKYQSFVDTYPQNEWADDALYKVYQYYYAVGLYKTADAKLTLLNEQYPNSIYAKREVKPVVKAETQSVVKTEQPLNESSLRPVVDEKKEVVAPSATSGNFVVQIGVYSQELKAKQQAQEFTSTVGTQAIVFAKQSGGRTVYAVAFEGFANEQSARLFGGELKSKFNLDWFVVKR